MGTNYSFNFLVYLFHCSNTIISLKVRKTRSINREGNRYCGISHLAVLRLQTSEILGS